MILKNYFWGVSKAFTSEEIEEIHTIASKINEDIGKVGEGVSSDPDGNIDEKFREEIRSSTVKWMERLPDHLENKMSELMFRCLDETGWRFTIDEHQPFQYTIYNAQPQKPKGDFYTWHTDAGPLPYKDGRIRKLSMTIQLSDPEEYEGGYFQWLVPNQIFDRLELNQTKVDLTNAISTTPFSMKEKGSILFFPSFLYHQVTPVTWGTRKSLVGWMIGQPYV